MAKRVESPSSLNTFKQCKRKYYYQYVEKLPTLPNIHQVRGNIAHSCLEDFYDLDISTVNEDGFEMHFKKEMQKMLLMQWMKYKPRLQVLKLNKDQERFYFEETMLMLMNWTGHFLNDVQNEMEKGKSLQEAFKALTPIREMRYQSDNYSVQGFIDAIHHLEDEVHIVDYKTNAKFDFKDSIRLQLAIYSLLYFEKHGVLPSKVGIFFLRQKLKMISVDEELLKLAQREIELVHAHTSITENIFDYPRTITPLCRWSTGECDFYKTCKPHNQKN
ncbi:hypothetical protein COV20_05370 [Candidatus Woesearchaeota archaeon CG10_big_fil_rev_8_21_14_0_10_45_16]|nr:MAG: hypothetical protein COV20_05370 [Candidatus Woesearchaeota archaeon CG10_big_fil_rev_8_21_14_0_10_45_16]